MDRISLQANSRDILGKKVKNLRKSGLIPGHVFGNKIEGENVTVSTADFLKVFRETGESGLINLKIGSERVRPVLVRNFQVDPVKGDPVHVDFYQVNLNKPVQVTVPIEVVGEEPELVHTGEAVVIQPMNEIEVEALPNNLPDHIEVNITTLRQIDDAILVSQLQVPEGVTLLAEGDALVVKLDTAVTAEMEEIMAEAEAAEQAAAETETETTEGVSEEGEETTEAENSNEEASQPSSEQKPQENS